MNLTTCVTSRRSLRRLARSLRRGAATPTAHTEPRVLPRGGVPARESCGGTRHGTVVPWCLACPSHGGPRSGPRTALLRRAGQRPAAPPPSTPAARRPAGRRSAAAERRTRRSPRSSHAVAPLDRAAHPLSHDRGTAGTPGAHGSVRPGGETARPARPVSSGKGATSPRRPRVLRGGPRPGPAACPGRRTSGERPIPCRGDH